MRDSNLLFESIFKRKLSDAGTFEYLAQVVKEHPYFAPAQFFLLLQTEKSTIEYQKQAAKTSLLFNNPYWLQFQLQETKGNLTKAITEPTDRSFPELPVPGHSENLSSANGEIVLYQHHNDTTKISHLEVEAGDKFIDDTAETNVVQDPVPTEDEAPVLSLEEEVKENNGTLEIAIPAVEPALPPAFQTVEQETIPGNEDNAGPVIEEQLEPVPDLPSLHANSVEAETNNDIEAIHIETPDLAVPEQQEEITEPTVTTHFNNEASPLINEPETDEEPPEPEIAPLNFRLNIDTSNVTEDRISFEPLHTSDYFASLGIRLSGEIKASDKLGKQLKSFTEWLKTMKKIHGDQLPEQSGQTDQSIQKLAEQSNKEAGVLTEAMAEVLLQQGKAAKAIEVYKKLSLLNPSKSTYFAAKIDQLKEH